MVQVDWQKIRSANLDLLEDDEAEVDKYFTLLDLADPAGDSEENDPAEMKRLFYVTRQCMRSMKKQYDFAVSATEELVQEEVQDKVEQIRRLQSELESHERFSGQGDKYYHTEISRLQDRNEYLEKEIENLDGQLRTERSNYDRVSTDMQALDARYQSAKRELDQANADIKEYQRQFSSQRDNSRGRNNQFEQARDELTRKNRELSEYLDDIKNLQVANDQLQEDLENAKSELKQATEDMNSMANDYSKLKNVLEDTDKVCEEMRKERDILRSQLQDMEIQMQVKSDGDDKIMSALNEKVTEWKDILASKDTEIKAKQKEITELQSKIQVSRLDSDSNKRIKLAEENASKDDQIKTLKEKLELATKDYQDVTSQINALKNRNKDGSASLYQQKKIQKLNETLDQHQVRINKEMVRVEEAEKDVIDKDRQIAELINKVIQYEQGQYGLPEAVQELKDARVQVRIRESQLQETTKEANRLHLEINDLSLENEEMRERLGLESREDLDLIAIRKKKMVKEEQTIALNSVLQKEVEKLEEERVQLKKALRKQALDRGQKAVELGLTARDLEPNDSFTDALLPKNKLKTPPHTSPNRRLNFNEDPDYEQMIEQIKKVQDDNKVLKEENRQFEAGLREMNAMFRQNAGPNTAVQIPALEKLIQIFEQRSATGKYDSNVVHIQAEMNKLFGRNAELRDELRNCHAVAGQVKEDYMKSLQKIIDQDNEINLLREASEKILKLNPLPLPAGVNPTSKEIISCLNEYTIQILQELSNKEEICTQMQNALEQLRRNYSVAKHQQSILYKDHFEMKESIAEQAKTFEYDKGEFLVLREKDKVKIDQFEKLLGNLKACDEKPKQIVAELTRKITVLRVNEKSLTRRYTIIQEVEKNLRKENAKTRKEVLDMEAAVTTKIGDLERHKEMSTYRITSLQKQLEETVPAHELEIANKQYNELTAKYRDILQRDNNFVSKTNAIETLQAELAAYQHTDKTLKHQLQSEKEKSYTLEQTLNDLLHKVGNHGYQPNNEENAFIARRIATTEMKEVNERGRADHAELKYEHARTLTVELEKRNTELEGKFADIAKLNLECQKVERELREQLDGSVPAEINRIDKELNRKLEEREGILKTECHKLKEIADISQHQVETITLKQQSQEKELTSVRKQLYELQMETDEKTIIAKLHQHIVALQVSESTAVRKFEVTRSKFSKAEVHIMKLQKQLDEKDNTMHHLRSETRSKARFLKKTIQDLRRQFSGALTLGAQERFHTALQRAHDKRDEYQKKLNEIKQNHAAVEEDAMRLQIQNDGLKELIAALKDGQGAKKVAEWHSRMGEIKLEDMKLKRQIELDKEQIVYLEKVISRHESSNTMLEFDIAKQSKEFEDRQLLWEQHEVELERTIAKLETQQKELADAARKFEEATGSIPDDTLPLANQLDIAVTSIKQHIKTIIVTRAECNRVKEFNDEMEEKVRLAETALMQKDRVINELRLRLPISDREVTYTQALETPQEENLEAAQTVKVAQATIESLKLLLKRKDENIAKYQDMLSKSREELKSQMTGHQKEIKVIQDRLQLEIEEHVQKMKKVHKDYLNAPQQQIPTNKQIKRLIEVEDMLVEQDNALGEAAVKYNITQEDIKKIREESEKAINTLNQRIQMQQKENENVLKNFNEDIGKVKATVKEKELEIEVLGEELDSVREANKKAPSKTIKNLVERLRDQLAKKDKEQKALSQALLQIQSDMVCSAEENVKAYAKKVEDEMSVQIIIERETSEMKGRIEDLQTRVDKMKKELKKKKETELKLAAELETMTLDIQKKDNALKEVGEGLKQYEDIKTKCDQLKDENKKLVEQLNNRAIVSEDVIRPIEAFVEQREGEGGGVDLTDLDDKPVKEMKDQKESEQPTTSKDSRGKEDLIRWDESKKWQKKFDALKTKLKEKLEECEKLNKTNGMLREGFSRQEKDKLALQNKLKTLSRGIHPTEVFGGISKEREETIVTLKQRIFQLEEENNNLSRQLNLDRDKEIQELRIQISQQNESINALESQLLKRQKAEDPNSYNWTMEREKTLKKEMLEIRKENMELMFEKEQASKDLPRLKARVADLEGYVDVLKNEIETLEKKEKNRKSAMGTGMGGQTVEDMERTVGAMRRVVERLQVENESLKKPSAKGKVPKVDLTKENRALKQEIQKLKQMQASDNKRTTQSKRDQKMVAENDQLCRDLHKEKEQKDELKIEKQGLEKRVKNLLETIDEKDKALLNASSKSATNPQKEFLMKKNSQEEQLQAMQNEVEKKNQVLKDIKVHLRGAAERETNLLRQVDELEERIVFLQDFPPGIETEMDAAKHLQQARLQIKRLEAEKKELMFEVERLNKMTNNGTKSVDVTQDEVLNKLRNYDKMMANEVDLRMKMKITEGEKEKLIIECNKLREELSAFDPAFFEELEDLKYNYKVSIERNVLFERQLRQLSAQFGVQVNIPNDDDDEDTR